MDRMEMTNSNDGLEPVPYPGRDLPPPPIDDPRSDPAPDLPPLGDPPRNPARDPAKIA
jgi:hypothetical protein